MIFNNVTVLSRSAIVVKSKFFGGVFVLSLAFHFLWYGGFCHKTGPYHLFQIFLSKYVEKALFLTLYQMENVV